jgi:hypothetical protein
MTQAESAERSKPWLVPDRLWEKMLAWTTVLHDEGRYRCWTQTILNGHQTKLTIERGRAMEVSGNATSYGESVDGWNWTKPSLKLDSWGGSLDNNLVSPDGFRWKRNPKPLVRYFSDTENVIAWDPLLGKYVGYFRQHVSGRTIARPGDGYLSLDAGSVDCELFQDGADSAPALNGPLPPGEPAVDVDPTLDGRQSVATVFFVAEVGLVARPGLEFEYSLEQELCALAEDQPFVAADPDGARVRRDRVRPVGSRVEHKFGVASAEGAHRNPGGPLDWKIKRDLGAAS